MLSFVDGFRCSYSCHHVTTSLRRNCCTYYVIRKHHTSVLGPYPKLNLCCSYSRRDFVTLILVSLPWFSASEKGPERKPTVTNRAYFDISVGNEYLGRMVFDLYGREAPETVSTFLQFLKGIHGKDEKKDALQSSQEEDYMEWEDPFVNYDFSLFYRCSPGLLLEGGKIPNLRLTSVGDTTFYDTGGALIVAKPQLETNSLKHSERGLLTRKRLQVGPEFGITLAARSELDATHTVFGKLERGYEVLDAIEDLPVLIDPNRKGGKTLSSKLFDWQRNLFLTIGRDIFHDKRADEIYPYKLLRRVAVMSSGLL